MEGVRVIIAGTRTFGNYALLESSCTSILSGRQIAAVLCGECKGADLMGKRFAESHGICVESFPAEWKRYGRAAGVRRNKQMAENADCLIAFWDGVSHGTANMIKLMKGKEIHVVFITESAEE